MFINLSNHPVEKWDEAQIAEAKKYGEIKSISFPAVPATADESYVHDLALEYFEKVQCLLDDPNEENAVMVQGEFTFTYSVVELLKENGIKAIAACSERNVVSVKDSKGESVKEVRFCFVRFREY